MCGLDIMLALHELHKSHSSRSQHQQNGAKHCKILFPGQTAVFLKDQFVSLGMQTDVSRFQSLHDFFGCLKGCNLP